MGAMLKNIIKEEKVEISGTEVTRVTYRRHFRTREFNIVNTSRAVDNAALFSYVKDRYLKKSHRIAKVECEKLFEDYDEAHEAMLYVMNRLRNNFLIHLKYKTGDYFSTYLVFDGIPGPEAKEGKKAA